MNVNRRKFFRVGLRQLLDPVVGAIDSVNKASRLVQLPPKIPLSIRPPGALPEQRFRETCSRGGECVSACPARAIKLDRSGMKGNGAPYIDVDEMPCVLCDGLYCMHACASGALMPVALVEIDMGIAQWKQETCLRSNGQDCAICVDKCPLGSAAIEMIDGKIRVHESGCTGCGVCQHECPTAPRSIVIQPVA